jgi:hypothetical protein
MAKVIVKATDKATDKGWEIHQDDVLLADMPAGAGHWRRWQSCGRN